MRPTLAILAGILFAGCEAAPQSVPTAITLETGPLVEAIRDLKPAPKAEWTLSEPSAAEKAVERLAEVFAERERRALERETAAVKAVEPQPVAHAADAIGDYTGCVVCVGDPDGVLAGTSDCIPCNLVPKAIARANATLPPDSPKWTIGTTRMHHFWLRHCDDPATPVFQFYEAGKRTGSRVGFGGGIDEMNAILRQHPGVLKEPPKQSAERRWTRQQAPPVQGVSFRDDWGPDPQPVEPDNGGSCGQPQSFGCGAPQVWSAPVQWSRPLQYTCRNGVCRWE